jgi:hypothetical protein
VSSFLYHPCGGPGFFRPITCTPGPPFRKRAGRRLHVLAMPSGSIRAVFGVVPRFSRPGRDAVCAYRVSASVNTREMARQEERREERKEQLQDHRKEGQQEHRRERRGKSCASTTDTAPLADSPCAVRGAPRGAPRVVPLYAPPAVLRPCRGPQPLAAAFVSPTAHEILLKVFVQLLPDSTHKGTCVIPSSRRRSLRLRPLVRRRAYLCGEVSQ